MSIKIHIKLCKKYELRRWYVYLHKTNDEIIYYVGKGVDKRAFSTRDKQRKHKNIQTKFGFNVEIIYYTYDQDDAYEVEKEYIKKFHTFVDDPECNKYACNFTAGGEKARILCKEAIQKISESHSGEKHYMYNKTHTQEYCDNMSLATSGEKNGFYNHTHTLEVCEKLRKNREGKTFKELFGDEKAKEIGEKLSLKAKGRKLKESQLKALRESNKVNKIKAVYQFDLNMNFIAKYKSIKEAVEILNKKMCACSCIVKCCKGKQKTAYGFIWRYASDVEKLDV
jgi:hypothetical protein